MKKLITLVVAALMLAAPVMAATVGITADNTNAHSEFHAIGDFSSLFSTATEGSYLDTNVQASTAIGADFDFSGWQKLSGYTNNNVQFSTWASGSTAYMNNRFDNSNYVVQLERVDTSQDFLSASGPSYGIGWNMGIVDRTTQLASAGTQAQVWGGGSAVLDSGQWFPTSTGYYGWGNPDSLSAPDKPGYYTPVNTVSATGSGTFQQDAFGSHSLEFNGFNFVGGGSADFTGKFINGFSGSYSMYAG